MIAAIAFSIVTLTQVDSSYDRRALWLSHGPGSTGIVEGLTGPLVGEFPASSLPTGRT